MTIRKKIQQANDQTDLRIENIVLRIRQFSSYLLAKHYDQWDAVPEVLRAFNDLENDPDLADLFTLVDERLVSLFTEERAKTEEIVVASLGEQVSAPEADANEDLDAYVNERALYLKQQVGNYFNDARSAATAVALAGDVPTLSQIEAEIGPGF